MAHPAHGAVLKWLNSTGFPLEMEAARAFRQARFHVRQSTPFVDSQSDKSRELDVLATDPDWIGALEIHFVVECKSSSKPWVVLTSADALAGYNRLFAFSLMTESARHELAEGMTKLDCWPFVERPDEGGYGFRQALTESPDVAYAASMSVLKGCEDFIRQGESKSWKPLVFAFPVIVVDSPLFECRLNDSGELDLKEVAQSQFLFAAHIPKPVGCCIRVITRKELNTFSTWARDLSNILRADFKSQEAKVLGGLHQSPEAP